MKKTQFIDLIQTIKKNIVAFISMCIFVVLAVGLFLGIGFSSTATYKIADNISLKGNYHDLNILYPYGFTNDDINTIKALNSSYKVEGYYYTYEYLDIDGTKNQISITQINDEIDMLYDIEGNLPSKKGEIAIEKNAAKLLNLKIGDTVTFNENNSDNLELINQSIKFDSKNDNVEDLMNEETGKGYLSTYTFKVTALVNTPTMMHSIKNMYGVSLSNGLNLDGFMFVSEDSFKKEAFIGYPGLLIKDESLIGLSLFSDEYKEAVNKLKTNVEDTINSIADKNNALVLSSVDNVINAADNKLNEGKSQIDDAEKEIANKENQIISGQNQIISGQNQIASNTRKLNNGQVTLNDALIAIDDGEKQINENEKLLKEASEKIEDGKKQISDAESQIALKESEINSYQETIDSIKSLVNDEVDKGFEDTDKVINPIKELNLDELSKEELISILKSIIDSTYTLFNDQGYYYTELYRFGLFDEVFEDGNFYTRMQTIPFTKGASHISAYLSDHEDSTSDFYNRDKYIESYQLINEIISTEDNPTSYHDDLADAIDEIVGDNRLEEECKSIIYDPILEEFYSESDNEKIINTIKYLIENYDLYKSDYNIIKSAVNTILFPYQEELDNAKETLNEYKQELESKKKELEDGINAYNDGKAKLDEAKTLLENAKKEYATNKSLLDSSWNELNNAISRLNSAKIQLSSAIGKLNKAKEELSDAKQEYESSKKTVDDFKKTREDIRSYEATYLTALDNASIHSFRTIAGILMKIKYTMAGLFLAIGLLVCYFSILRMVNDHIKLIGTKKALGFHTKEITRTYLLFTGISTVVGCVLGVILGTYAIQKIVMSAVISSSTYNGTLFAFDMFETIIICLAEIVLLLVIAYATTRIILKENAVVLLAGPKPPSGKKHFYEKFKLWKNISLFDKTIINNCIADKRRVLGTLVGVCGCTALIVTALTLNNCLAKNFNKQFGELFKFDSIIYYDGEESKTGINNILAKYNVTRVDALKTYTVIKDNNGGSLYAFLIVPEDEDGFKQLVNMEAMTNKDSDPYKGLWVTYAYKNYYKDSINDEFAFTTLSGVNAKVKANGYFSYYLMLAQMFMDKDTYKEANNGEYHTNSILINTDNVDKDALLDELKNVEGFIQLENFKAGHKESFDIMQNLAIAIIVIYVTLSFAMAILVLLNLYTMFVNEKKKELITLMINGYSIKDTKKYISRDTVLLTTIGIILGIILGTEFGFISIDTFNTYVTYVYKEFDLMACLIGTLTCAILSYIMCKIALRRVNKFKMSDINN